MSFILDALKKADRKRKLGKAPDLHTVHEIPGLEEPKRMLWPYIVAIALFVNAAIIAWWLSPWKAEEPPPPAKVVKAPEKVEVPEVVEKNEPQEKMLFATDTRQLFATDVSQTIEGGARMPRGRKAPPASFPPLPGMSPPPQIESPAGDFASEGVDGALPGESGLAAGPEEGDGFADLAFDEEGQDLTGDEAALEEEAPTKKEGPPETVPYLYQLPDAFQELVPELNISFHSYTRDPAARIVSINGKILRQGQSLDDQLKLVEILENGVVFYHKEKEAYFKIGLE